MITLLTLLSIAPPRTLIVGGGPNPSNNQIAIESNVQYCAKNLPKGSTVRILFADGDKDSATIRYTPEGERPGPRDKYKSPELPRIDGAASLENVKAEINTLAKGGSSPVLLYFTGHGTIPRPPTPPLSFFNLWKFEQYTAIDMAASIAAFPKDVPVIAIMVQCHAGGFAKSLFKDGDPKQAPMDNRFCGFYASIESRTAAGCTSMINEADYRDFTTYFMGALIGTSRTGQKVAAEDYDKNGFIGMNEAFCWSLINDESIDTPVCTSDEFLRRVVTMPEDEVFATPYSNVLKWATPAQRAALEALSKAADLQGEDRLTKAFATYPRLTDRSTMKEIRGFRFVRLAKTVVLGQRMLQHPDAGLKKRYETLLKDESVNPFRT